MWQWGLEQLSRPAQESSLGLASRQERSCLQGLWRWPPPDWADQSGRRPERMMLWLSSTHVFTDFVISLFHTRPGLICTPGFKIAFHFDWHILREWSFFFRSLGNKFHYLEVSELAGRQHFVLSSIWDFFHTICLPSQTWLLSLYYLQSGGPIYSSSWRNPNFILSSRSYWWLGMTRQF